MTRGLALRLAIVAAVALGLALAYRFGVFSQLANPKSLAASLVALGVWGYLGFVLTYALLQPFGVPGTVFIVAAPLIWPWPVAFALSMTGTMAATVIGFSFARFLARDWVSARIPERFRKYDQALQQSAFRTVFVLRLIFWMPQALHAFFGVSRVPFWTHFFGSLLGYAPPLLLVSYMGAELFDESGGMQPQALWMMGGLLLFSITLVVSLRRYDRMRAASRAAAQVGARGGVLGR
jgi:uncharacterized membrane protein YdjX (TVP38/TMEM64 family)